MNGGENCINVCKKSLSMTVDVCFPQGSVLQVVTDFPEKKVCKTDASEGIRHATILLLPSSTSPSVCEILPNVVRPVVFHLNSK